MYAVIYSYYNRLFLHPLRKYRHHFIKGGLTFGQFAFFLYFCTETT